MNEVLAEVIGVVSGGTAGAVITTVVSAYRSRVQPIGRSIDVSPIFAAGARGNGLVTRVTIDDGTREYTFPNLYVANVRIANRGNRDFSTFTFGITLAPEDRAVYVEPYGSDRHHVFLCTNMCTPATPTRELDFRLRPLNRGDVYTFKAFIVAGEHGPGSLSVSSAEAIRFTDIPNASTLLATITPAAVRVAGIEFRIDP